ncbi:hypothetical protein N5D61_05140 [Pseudomonas sp. GD03842]|uniref:hypothetical protein n=1 Tax=Pseudomonas sp. GD03842 TaxID=2975385 RepID=UPI002448BDF6|nr:hypothetical protein [Pseudomonas sp. GD03842]MDH0745724.1 hypothetical protein [Pseudomonas sp. GD03842]
MRNLLAALVFLVLTGCASSFEEQRADGPTEVFTSAKPVDQVSRCVFFNWQKYTWYGSPLSVLIQPNEHGGSTVSAGQSDFFVDVTAKGYRTRIDYYGSGMIGKELQPLVKSCL